MFLRSLHSHIRVSGVLGHSAAFAELVIEKSGSQVDAQCVDGQGGPVPTTESMGLGLIEVAIAQQMLQDVSRSSSAAAREFTEVMLPSTARPESHQTFDVARCVYTMATC